MTGRHRFSQLEARMAPERRTRVDRLAGKPAQQIDRIQTLAEPQLSEALLTLLRQHPNGLTHKQIREKLGFNTAAEQPISDALQALTAAKRIFPKDRRYLPA